MQKDNPSGFGLTLEIGYAAALGKQIILVDEKSSFDEIFEQKFKIEKFINRKQNNNEKLDASEQALVDAFGIFEVAQGSDELSKAYKRGQSIGGSVAWMEQFALTRGLGSFGEKTATKMLDGTSSIRIWRSPSDTVSAKPARSPRVTNRLIAGNATVETATEKIPCGSM